MMTKLLKPKIVHWEQNGNKVGTGNEGWEQNQGKMGTNGGKWVEDISHNSLKIKSPSFLRGLKADRTGLSTYNYNAGWAWVSEDKIFYGNVFGRFWRGDLNPGLYRWGILKIIYPW